MLSPLEGVNLLRAEGASEKLVLHSKTVRKVAEIVASGVKSNDHAVDIEIVRLGGLLHDIGRTKVNGIEHGYMGADILRSKGVDERLARFCETHIGGGISSAEARRLKLPERDYVPRTLEEKIVCYSDKLSGVNEVYPLSETFAQFRRQGIETKPLEMIDHEIRSYLEFDGYDYVKMKFHKDSPLGRFV
jgi:uncharacterized protein (TIGR00295 family)